MKNLPVKESEWFCHEFELAPLAIVTKRVSQDQTEKYVFRLEGGQTLQLSLYLRKARCVPLGRWSNY